MNGESEESKQSAGERVTSVNKQAYLTTLWLVKKRDYLWLEIGPLKLGPMYLNRYGLQLYPTITDMNY